jgi:hypothetical protein
MSEIFELMQQARRLAETAKDAMQLRNPSAPDTVSAELAKTILKEAKRLLPKDTVVQALNFSDVETPWVSVRSAMEAITESLSAKNAAGIQAANQRRPRAM